MDDEEPTPVYFQATCRTPGCPAEGESEVVPLYPNATEPIYRASCGQCNKIPELVPVP